MYRLPARRPLVRALFAAAVGLALVLAGCATAPRTATQPAQSTATQPPTQPAQSAATAPPTQPAQSAATAAPAATSAPAPASPAASAVITATAALAPLQPLRTAEIVDRPLRNRRALTDGARHYRLAAWDPGSDWIAAMPQDGPGLDAINTTTGEVRAIVTDTYVLEPVWLAPAQVAVQLVAAGADRIVRYAVDDPAAAPVELARSDTPIRGVGAAQGALSYATADGRLHLAGPAGWKIALDTLITAPGPDGSVALTPWTADLEAVQTLVARPTGAGITLTPLSAQGEGLWLPRWAPDGARLAMAQIAGRLITSAADGSARYDLGPGDLPAWSPDSRRLAYAGASAGKEFTARDIHIVDWQGAGPRLRVTNADAEQYFTAPTWSPDGTQIAFVEIDSGQIFVADAPAP